MRALSSSSAGSDSKFWRMTVMYMIDTPVGRIIEKTLSIRFRSLMSR